MFQKKKNYLEWTFDDRTLRLIPWGRGIRVRETKENFISEDWALTEKVSVTPNFEVNYENGIGSIQNGKIKATVTDYGKITFYNVQGKILLEEYWRVRRRKVKQLDGQTFVDVNMLNNFVSALKLEGRELCPRTHGDYELTVRFEANDDEKIFGMGQYQQKQLNLKYCKLELAHRNSQASVPFAVSSNGYGMLWNNPAIGSVTFAKNITEWKAIDTKEVDYWICAGDTPKELLEEYTEVTGRAPIMPEYGLGLWQSKLRYRTQDEVIDIARDYKRRGVPLSVVVIDYFHWPCQGDFKFDKNYWPNPQKMVDELGKMGVKVMVSIWPNIDKQSENYQEMLEKGLLIRADKGPRLSMLFQGNTTFFDATNQEAREFVWEKVKENYYKNGISIFWLDEAEPEYSPYDYDLYRLKKGRNMQVGNLYPKMYAKGFYDGMTKEGQKNVVNLIRSAWAGSQKYGALVWTGDIDSSFRSFRYQYQCGLNMGMAGIPWWTTDIGGFHGGKIDDDKFRECVIRWFEFGAFCPVLRMHGDREPHTSPMGTTGGGKVETGAGNEIWSFGEKAYEIMAHYVAIREQMKPYIRRLMEEAHETGHPVMRPLFFDFPEDKKTWSISDQHMFGSDVLVAPIMECGMRERELYLPATATWIAANTHEIYEGGQTVKVDAPLDYTPVFFVAGSDVVADLSICYTKN